MNTAPVTVALVEHKPEVLATVVKLIGVNPKLNLVHTCTTTLDMMCWLSRNRAKV